MLLKELMLVASMLLGISVIVFAAVVDVELKGPIPKVINFDPTVTEYVRLLGGAPETVTMRSGLVVLKPGESVGTHNTDNYEEVLVVLEGIGIMTITDGPKLSLTTTTMAYCPSRTEHNVTNTGDGILRYIYIVANTM